MGRESEWVWGTCAMRMWVHASFCSKHWASWKIGDLVGWVRDPRGVPAGLLNGQRGHAGTQGIYSCAHACEPGEWHVGVYTSDLQPLPAQREEETGLCAYLWCVSYTGAVEVSTLAAQPALPMSCVCPVHLGQVLSFPTGWTCKRERGSHIPQSGQRPQVSGALSWDPADGQDEVLGQGARGGGHY